MGYLSMKNSLINPYVPYFHLVISCLSNNNRSIINFDDIEFTGVYIMKKLSTKITLLMALTLSVFCANAAQNCQKVGEYQSGDGRVITFECNNGLFIDVIIYSDGTMESHVLR